MRNTSLAMQKQAALHERRHAQSRRRRTFITIIFILLVVGFFIVIREPFLRASSVRVSDSGLVDARAVEAFVSQKISGYRFFLIPRDSLLFLDKDVLGEAILTSFPRLSSAVVHKGRVLHIVTTEPVFETMYCKLELGVPTGCALLHTNGKAGSVAPHYSYAPIFAFYSESANLTLGTSVIGIDEIARIDTLRSEITSYGMPTYGFVYGATYDEVLLDTGENFATLPRIRILPGVTKDKIHQTLGVAMEDAAVKKLLLERLNELEYVDLRFDGQVVYKRRDAE